MKSFLLKTLAAAGILAAVSACAVNAPESDPNAVGRRNIGWEMACLQDLSAPGCGKFKERFCTKRPNYKDCK